MWTRIMLGTGALAAGVLVVAGALQLAWGGGVATERVSIAADATQGNGASASASVSADGRFVAFVSDASNLVPDDSGGIRDIFVQDRLTGVTERVSIATDGSQANDHSSGPGAGPPRISADGRYVVFASAATNLAPDDTNDADDIFVRDRTTGATERVSVASDGAQGNNDSITPSISGDGRYVTFTSLASNLVPGDANNDRDVFVHDRLTGASELASVASDGTQGNFASGGLGAGPASMSGDGRYVVFGSLANNLVPGDTNGFDDIFVRDRVAAMTERVSLASGGGEGNGHSISPSISDDGRYVVFASAADALTPDDDNRATDIFGRDRQTGETVLLSVASNGQQGNGPSRFPVISDDGLLVAFQSEASNLVPNDTNSVTDVFLFHMQGGAVERSSVAADGSQGNGGSGFPALSGDGQAVAFESLASNLVLVDTNGASDVFVRGELLRTLPTPPPTATNTPTATATATSTPAPTRTPTPSATPETLVGDANCNRRVDSIDAALALQLTARLVPSLRCQRAADVNRDGRVDAVDAALILQFVAGLLPGLPP